MEAEAFMTDMVQLFKLIDQLSPEERNQLAEYLYEGKVEELQSNEPFKRTFDLHAGVVVIHDNFDDPIPDEFWLGGDNQ
ncbi:MAG: hypothetical protein U0528_10835 [Anaerolineae bacterium]|nr:hypothetical protein [Anaerolineae bacterium]